MPKRKSMKTPKFGGTPKSRDTSDHLHRPPGANIRNRDQDKRRPRG